MLNKMRRQRGQLRPMRVEALEDRIVFAVPDFGLADVNLTSPTYNETVSPRDYIGQVTGWYFGHST